MLNLCITQNVHVYICRTEPTSAGQKFSRDVVWNCSKVALLAMSQLESHCDHYGFHELKTWLTWWQSIGIVKLYSSKTNELQTALSIQMTQSFVPRFRPPEGKKVRSQPSPPRWLVHWWTTCAAGQIKRRSQKITMAWRDACENNEYTLVIVCSRHHSWCTSV